MHMATKSRPWTRADLERLPDDGNKYEVIHGELLVSPAPLPPHDAVVRAVRRRLESYCDRHEIGHVSDHMPAFVTPDSEVIPDIAVREAIVPPPETWDDAPMPMLVVEVLSKATWRADTVKKPGFYMESGIPEYWIVDRHTRTIRVVTPNGDRMEPATVRWQPVAQIEPLELDVAELFAEALGPADISG